MAKRTALTALKERVRASLPGVAISLETPPVAESSSNGDIESQIRRSTALVRVLKCCLEAHLGATIPSEWPHYNVAGTPRWRAPGLLQAQQ